MSLTDAKIKSLKMEDTAYKKADGKGLSLMVKPTGTKAWRFSYSFNSKRKTLSLGTYPETSLKLARQKRDDAQELLAQGIDPSAHRKEAKAASKGDIPNNLRSIVSEFLEIKKQEWSDTTFRKVEDRLNKDVLPDLGDMPITAIKAMDILTALRKVQARGAIDIAHRINATLSQIFCYAIWTGRAERNPARDLTGALIPSKEVHMAAITDPDNVGPFLRKIHACTDSIVVQCALKLAPLVFVRPGELRQAQWADINFETAEWRFTASKTGHDHIVPLSRQAMDILKSIHLYSGHGRYVFPSNHADAIPMSSGTLTSALRRLGIEKEEMSGHGFRAMARTMIAERLRYADVVIELQLAHQVRDIHGHAYNRTSFLDDRKQMMQEWADYLDELKRGGINSTPATPSAATFRGSNPSNESFLGATQGATPDSNNHLSP